MTESAHWRRDTALSLLLLALLAGLAWWTRIWVITAVPVGFLFGFLLQKGDLCGASAFSEVVLMRDWRKIFGLWVAIVVSMVGFAVIAELEWVHLVPKPLLWLNYAVGGALFGAGTVLAGGCISGCLFKAGAGNLNSMVALTGIPLGIGMVEVRPTQCRPPVDDDPPGDVRDGRPRDVVLADGPAVLGDCRRLRSRDRRQCAAPSSCQAAVSRARRVVPSRSALAHRSMATVAGWSGDWVARCASVPVVRRHRSKLPPGRDARRPPGVRTSYGQSDCPRLEAGACPRTSRISTDHVARIQARAVVPPETDQLVAGRCGGEHGAWCLGGGPPVRCRPPDDTRPR